jgi:hypothetical protein
MIFKATITAAAMLATHPTAAEEHRFEADPVMSVRENFVACEVLSQLQRVMENPRFLLAGECIQRTGPYLRQPRAIRVHLSARHHCALQMDASESIIEMRLDEPRKDAHVPARSQLELGQIARCYSMGLTFRARFMPLEMNSHWK